MMKKNKAFTLIELIIVIAILVIIMLIGSVAYSGIRERMQVRSDKTTAGIIGKSLVLREVDVPKSEGVPLYPTITKYDDLEEVENYVAKGIKPQSMKDGNFYVTAFQTENGKKIVVGIGKDGDEFKDQLYTTPKKPGWAWSEDMEISEFIEENKDQITGEETGNEGGTEGEDEIPGGSTPDGEENGGTTGGTGGTTGGSGSDSETPGEEETPDNPTTKEEHTLTVGINNIVTSDIKKEEGKAVTVNLEGNYTEIEITGIDKTGNNLNFTMPNQNVKIIGITE